MSTPPEPTRKRPPGRVPSDSASDAQRGELGGWIAARCQRLAVHLGDRAVGSVDDGQGRGIGLDEQQPGLGVSDGAADHLGQRRGGQKRRHQHDVFNLAGGQRVTQRSCFDGVGPGHAYRSHLIAAVEGALASTEDGRHNLVCGVDCRRIGGRVDVEAVLVDRDAVGVFAFDENHADRSGRHRHAKYGVHFSSKAACSLTGLVNDVSRAG